MNNYRSLLGMLLSLLALSSLVSCKSAVYDDLTVCAREIAIAPYVQTACDPAPHYPEAVQQLRVCAFNSQGSLLCVYEDLHVALNEAYRLKAETEPSGKIKLLAWAGTDLSAFSFSSLQPGTPLKDITATLQHEASKVESPLSPIYVGEADIDLDANPATDAPLLVKLHLRELTYRVHFTITGIPTDRVYHITCRDNNTTYSLGGSILPAESVYYTTQLQAKDEQTLTATLHLMKLEKGRNAILTIQEEGKPLPMKSINIVEDLFTKDAELGNPYNLDCDHDVEVALQLRLVNETYILVVAKVNDWNLVLRDIHPGAE